MAGTGLQSAFLNSLGIAGDRRWMLVDEQGDFMHQREHPELALFKPVFHEHFLEIFSSEGNVLKIDLRTPVEDEAIVSVWDDTFVSARYPDYINQWFTAQLGKPCNFVFFDESRHFRQIDQRYGSHDDGVAFSDGYPVLIISEESLNDLNQRLEVAVPMNRFRPNLVVSGGEPFFEDQLKEFSIGEVRFKVVKPCARCMVTTIDQKTLLRSHEPLKTLARYRKFEQKILFGVYALVMNEGRISVGQELQLLD